MATTARNIDKTARTAYEMAEAQRDSFEAVAENFAAAQRRTIGLAEGGLEFVRLQEQNARAAQEFFANGVRLLQHQQKNAEFVGGWMGDAVEVVREQTEQNARTAEAFARSVSTQQESMRALTQGWVGAYRDFFSPFAYVQEGMRAFQRAAQQGLEVTEQVARQGLRDLDRGRAGFCCQLATRWPHSWRGIVSSGCDLMPMDFRRNPVLDTWANEGVALLSPRPPLYVFPLARRAVRRRCRPLGGPRILRRPPWRGPCGRALS